jgi:hypothetical protein
VIAHQQARRVYQKGILISKLMSIFDRVQVDFDQTVHKVVLLITITTVAVSRANLVGVCTSGGSIRSNVSLQQNDIPDTFSNSPCLLVVVCELLIDVFVNRNDGKEHRLLTISILGVQVNLLLLNCIYYLVFLHAV